MTLGIIGEVSNGDGKMATPMVEMRIGSLGADWRLKRKLGKKTSRLQDVVIRMLSNGATQTSDMTASKASLTLWPGTDKTAVQNTQDTT